MSDFTPPTPPNSIQNNQKFQKFALIFFLVAVFILIAAIIIPGDNTNSSPDTTQAPATTQYVAPVNKYEEFYDYVINNSGKAYVYTKGEIIEFGELVCSALDSGKTIDQVVIVLETSANDMNDVRLFAAIVYSAINNICTEYIPELNVYLNT